MTAPQPTHARWIAARVTLAGLPGSYPALVALRRRRAGHPVVRVTWPVLARLAVDLVGRWRDRRDLTLLPAIITVHDGQAHAIRFGDRDGDVQPLPADADGLYTVAGPLWPWQVTMWPLIAGRDRVAADGSRGPDRCPGDGGAGRLLLSAPQCGGAPNDGPCRVDRP
ncbi:hypothetical protein AB0I61_31900 [Polymorphospora rubra]|uniref:hypothetical protein n=1 Tax=Polymorphospora rubra TaxID=338584 RepID=UPI0033F42072